MNVTADGPIRIAIWGWPPGLGAVPGHAPGMSTPPRRARCSSHGPAFPREAHFPGNP